MKKAIFAGTFNPIHKGHKKIVMKSLKIFDEIYIVVANNDFKNQGSDIEKRFEKVKQELSSNNVKFFMLDTKLLSDFAKKHEINFLVRSARNNTDFKYELDMAKGNKELHGDLETVIIIPDYEDIEWSSTKLRNFVKENK